MGVQDKISKFHDEMTGWRRDIHAHPETAFEEHRTSAFIAEKLESFGIEIDRGLAGTGIVGIIKGKGDGDSAIGLRADIDALDITEQTNKPYSSKNPGKMHACGHDGHTTMLLGAAKYLAETRDFSGTAYVIFQPAEENEGGGRVMVEQGLFEKFPMSEVYGLHNWPGMKVGEVGVRVGPMMASYDIFDMIVTGHGAHGAMPHQGNDPIIIAAHLVTQLQTIASRNVDPLEAVVVSVTQFHGGDAYNVIPAEVRLSGTVRSFKPEVQDMAENNIKRIAKGVAATYGAEIEVRYERRYPPTVNAEAETHHAARVAAKVVGDKNIHHEIAPVMGSEDFAFMLQEKPGSYIWMGVGEDVSNLHSPQYDFNDELLPIGASYWATLVEETLK
ncbi:MAG: M20 aminoacylase family protein [Hyphomicrobiales bacterium]